MIVVQPDGKVLVGGLFEKLNGKTRNGFGRLNSDGTLDDAFDPKPIGPPYYTTVSRIVVQPDRKILLSGSFTNLGGQPRNGFGRLNPDGSLDVSFCPVIGGTVHSFAVQPDGKIIVGGLFTNLVGQARTNLGRLNGDGALDLSFHSAADGRVGAILLQPDGRILASGNFTKLAGEVRANVGRLNTNGTIDATFDAQANTGTFADALQADGRILVTGSFTSVGGYPRRYIARLNENGSVDDSFNVTSDFYVSAVAIQTDGRILVGGGFTNVAGQVRQALVRLNQDGTLDANFDAQLSGPASFGPLVWVNSVVIQADGRILVGGAFTGLAGQIRHSIGRLNATGPVTQSLTLADTTILWLRGGNGPEVNRASFEFSTDGVHWINLGPSTRIPGGWQCTNTAASANAIIRARGFVGRSNSEWFVANTTRPTIEMDDGGFGIRSNKFGFNIGGNPGEVVIVESSANMNDWTPVSTNLVGSGPFYFSDPGSINLPLRYYRTRIQ